MYTVDISTLEKHVQALECRYPHHNSAFAYGTRLAEEVGELIEIAYQLRDKKLDTEDVSHLVKEQQDVLRIAVGILRLYGLTDELPASFDDYTPLSKGIIELIVQLGTASGELATAINHAEGTGIKRQKHGDDASQQLVASATQLIQAVVGIIGFYGVEDTFSRYVDETYQRYQAEGLL